MNGVHDMGGMHGMGPIQPESDEPVFHEPWEARMFGLALAVGAWGRWSFDASRHQRELMPPEDYFRTSYYEKWLYSSVELMVRHGLITRAEIESGVAAGPPAGPPPMTTERVALLTTKGASTSRDSQVAPRFHVGQKIRTRNINPKGHTRLPRYARAKLGTIDRSHGVFVFPDSRAMFLGENPQHLYSVRFAAREVWGEQATVQDAIYLDLWEEYLEPV